MTAIPFPSPRRLGVVLMTFALLSGIAGCETAPPAHLRMLNALPASVTPASSAIKLQVLPVTLAEYLDRAELVRRSNTNEIVLSTDDVWAERLATTLARVVAADLTGLIPADVSAATPIGDMTFAGQISLDITAFEIDASGNAVLTGRWSLIDPATRQTVIAEAIHFTSPEGGAGESAAVSALNRTVDQASAQIATAIRAQISNGRLGRGN